MKTMIRTYLQTYLLIIFLVPLTIFHLPGTMQMSYIRHMPGQHKVTPVKRHKVAPAKHHKAAPVKRQKVAPVKTSQPHSGANTGFVTRSGTHLMLNGQIFRFAGANIHWLALDDSTNYPSQFRVNDALDTAKEMGLTVIRSHNMGISTGCPNCIEPSLNVFNETALEHDDYVIQQAAARGLRLIIPLTDNWHYPAGGKHTFTDWRGIRDENQFYYNPQVINDFKTYISKLLNRVNIYTGIAYKNDPTILAWETGNELQPPESWTQNISAYIKSIDKNHLVIDGRAGVDPNAARLNNIDILSNHYYPKSIAKMNADANTAAKAGKAFIVGEFDWNDANGGDPLGSFLSSVQANPNVSGNAFWELWSHNDQFGYVKNGDQYSLLYPGDTPAMRNSVLLLRQYAYQIHNQAVPPDSTPGAPLLETVIRNGTSNTLVWRGATFAATYTIERSTTGQNGPWSVICNQCATDTSDPWTDTNIPAGNLWYRVLAVNMAGITGPPSAAFQAGATSITIDNLNDWSHVYQHSNNLTFDTTNSQYMRGDTSRVVRTTPTHEFVIWQQDNMISFQAVTYFWPRESVSAFTIYTSANGTNWTEANPQIVPMSGDWQEFIYTLQGLSGVNYVKMVWNNTTGQNWNPNLGAVSILY
jgi:hypothetical protein